MLKLMIVEDERWEREGLQDFLDWNGLGIELPMLACDGIEGIEIARSGQPDIIITDIKMPGMDGLKMSARIREFLPDVKVIVLTGYDDFRLAQEAIRINAYAYILKPVEEQELYQTIRKMADECTTNRKTQEEYSRLKAQQEESSRILANAFLLDLLKGRSYGADQKQQYDLYKLLQEGPCLVMAFVAYVRQRPLTTDRELGEIGQCLEAIPISLSAAPVRLFYTTDPVSGIFYVVFCNAAGFETGAADCYRILAQSVPEEVLKKYAAGAGNPVQELELLQRSCCQAEEALDQAVFTGIRSLAFYDELSRNQKDQGRKVSEFVTAGGYYSKQLLHALKSGDGNRTEELLSELFGVIESNAVLGREMIGNYLYGLANEAITMAYHSCGDTETGSGTDAAAQLLSLRNLGEMKAAVHEILTATLDRFQAQKSGKDESIVRKVEHLIQTRYSTGISLKTISSEVFLSPNYLGSIFKKITDQSFNDYLCRVRMEKAKELLSSPKNKVSYVAGAVGIQNVSYFSVLFKNTCGISPGEYQESVIRERL